ncbi:MAG: flagellar export protein FliJ [Burkholderiaceae bacterium]
MQTLKPLLDHAEAQRNAALAAFNQTRAQRDAARTQAHDLGAYRDDYRQRWNSRFQVGAALAIVQCYRQFGDRLELAITQQANAVAAAERAFTRANDTLVAHELRVASVRKLMERRDLERWRGDERREQRSDDEFSQRMAARRVPDGVPT